MRRPGLKYLIFDAVNSVLPAPARRRLGRSALLEPLRDAFFRPRGEPECVEGEVEFEGCRFRFAAPYQVFQRAKRRGIERKICRLILARCRPGSVCVDAGANFGYLSLVMSLAARPGGRVLSFEPDPFICDVLRRNVASNGLEETCTVFQQRLGAIHEAASQATSVDRTVADLKLDRLDLIKVDVDGEDLEVLRGARETLERFHPVLVVEMVENQRQIYDLVAAAGYTRLLDMVGGPVSPPSWPANLIADVGERRQRPDE